MNYELIKKENFMDIKFPHPNLNTERLNSETDKLAKEINSLKKSKKEEKLKKVCEDFESLFLNYMIKEMRNTVHKYDLVEKSNAMKIYESMKYENLAKEISHNGGIGLAQLLYENLKQEIFS
jgi:flagellar protein FlgJ